LRRRPRPKLGCGAKERKKEKVCIEVKRYLAEIYDTFVL
jgi:hypothetical protein